MCSCIIPIIIIAEKLDLALSLILLTMLSAVTARAPGDGDVFCSLKRSLVIHPVYSSNTKILMDSFDYLNLLPPHDGALWQQLDLDDNNEIGGGTEVLL